MAYFTARVVLHSWADSSHYAVLHTAMTNAGFSRVVAANDGANYELPPAEYLLIGTYKIADVLAKAQSAAAQTGHTDSILVTEGVTLTWSGLKRVPK